MRAVLFETPSNPFDWLRWSFHHRDSHAEIIEAIAARNGPHLPDYPIDPVTAERLGDFLQYNSQLHSDMNTALNLQSADLLSADFDQREQLLAWIALHAREHESAELALGI